jgi:phosphatidyl-myo-inositol dimannoside synthase
MAEARLRTIVLTPDFPPAVGGIQRFLHGLLSNATRLDAGVVTRGDPGHSPDEEGLVIRRVPARGSGMASLVRLNLAALRAATRFRPDLIVSGHVVTSPAAAVLRRLLRRPVVQYLYGIELSARQSLTRFACARADVCIGLSRFTRELAMAAGAPADRIEIIPPGVDPVEERPVERFARPTIITVARLEDRYKGHDVMLRALPLVRRLVPDVQWLVVGDGPLRQHYEQLANGYGLAGAIQFVGEVADEERDRQLARAHVFAMLSRLDPRGGGEGFGIVYLEAAQSGLPVIAGNVGGAKDAVEHERTGLLVDPTDHVAVAEAASTLLTDGKLAEQLGSAGRARVQHFHLPLIAARTEELMFRIAGAAGRQA